jgi:hypothetical protein
MAQNPLFPNPGQDDDIKSSGYVLPKDKKSVEPHKPAQDKNAAANII